MSESDHKHDWTILKVESYENLTLRYRCKTCKDEIVSPSSAPRPPA